MGIFLNVLKNYGIAAIGGGLFAYFHLPLPWMLGPMFITLIWLAIPGDRKVAVPRPWRDISFILIGINFGAQFMLSTLYTLLPYILPYIAATFALIVISIGLGLSFAKITRLDQISSVFGSVPGGLSEMVLIGESLGANHAIVAVMQSMRIVIVLAIIPASITYLFSGGAGAALSVPASLPAAAASHWWMYLLFLVPGALAWIGRNHIPASFILVSLVVTMVLNIVLGPLPHIPEWIRILAQITIGIYLGKSISLDDLRLVRKYTGAIAGLMISMILVSAAIGWFLSLATSMDLPTAMLSIAPGGVIEMGLTATGVGADAALVTSLQLVRMLVILMLVPLALRIWIGSREKKPG